MLIIGERINTSRREIADATKARNTEVLLSEAMRQVEAGAHFLDVNAGTYAEAEGAYLRWIVETIRAKVDAPLCVDSTDPHVIADALQISGKGTMINSITAEKETYHAMLPLVQEYQCKVIALCLDDRGIPAELDDKLKVGFGLVDALLSDGIPAGDIYVDPLIMAVSTDQRSGAIALRVIREIRNRYPGVHAICGLSNVSFGLPARKLLNRVFLVAAMTSGLDAVIIDPLDKPLMANLIAANTLLGNDEMCMEYIRAYRRGKLQ